MNEKLHESPSVGYTGRSVEKTSLLGPLERSMYLRWAHAYRRRELIERVPTLRGHRQLQQYKDVLRLEVHATILFANREYARDKVYYGVSRALKCR